MIHPSLQVIDKNISDCIQMDFTIETLSSDGKFTEGPVWNEKGFYLFSDIPANCIYKIDDQMNKELMLANSGTPNSNHPDLNPEQAGSNGLAYDSNGDLLICQHGSHAIARYDGKEIVQVIGDFNGRPLNSPNDLILHKDGRLYFSDPPYGLRDGKRNPAKFQETAGVYCWNGIELSLICDTYQYPNGVCLSPDGRSLYICSNKPFEQFISVYDTESNQLIHHFAEENSDGMKFDPSGNLYLCNKEGIILLNKNGKRIGILRLPAIPANICWGGREGKDLFICARQYIFLIKDFLK